MPNKRLHPTIASVTALACARPAPSVFAAEANVMLAGEKLERRISQHLSSGFESDLFAAALRAIGEVSNPLRLNNFSYAMRELARHGLGRLAPDDHVLKSPWYTNETDRAGGITRRQRVRYAIQGGLGDLYVHKTLGVDSGAVQAGLVSVVRKLSKLTHIEPSTFDVPQDEVDTVVHQTLAIVGDVFERTAECHREIVAALWEQVDEAAVDELLQETIQSIDRLASHYSVEEILVEKIEIDEINFEAICFRARGSISCELQWGSNSDLRRGDGHVADRAFPFFCDLRSPVNDPADVEVLEDSLGVQVEDQDEPFFE